MKLIFNSSMPRSGSELLQVILHQNPRIYASTTSPLLEYQFGMRVNYELPEVRSQDPKLMFDAFIGACRGVADGYYKSITDREIVCDKNRGWAHYYEWVDQWNPQPKMICMVRDLRDVIASMEKIFRANRHRPIGPDDPAKLANMTTMERARYWLNTQPVGLALQRTLDSFQRGVAKNILFLRYEDLTNFPQPTMSRVYEYIGEPSFQHDFNNIVKTVYEDDSLFGPYGDHKVSKILKPSLPRQWENVLPPEVAKMIVQNNEWFFNCFSYV